MSPFQIFFSWLFDGNIKSQFPHPQVSDSGEVIVPDLLKYNSPITVTFLMKVFLRSAKLNSYLDKYFNNINLRYLDKEEFFRFIKQAVIDFKVNRRELVYYQYDKRDVLFEKLRKKMPLIKNSDLSLLCLLIEKSDQKNDVYNSLGMEQIKKTKSKQTEQKKISLKEFLMNFSLVEVNPTSEKSSTTKRAQVQVH
jgi:hypothetical protein